jgi:hypothetical protein
MLNTHSHRIIVFNDECDRIQSLDTTEQLQFIRCTLKSIETSEQTTMVFFKDLHSNWFNKINQQLFEGNYNNYFNEHHALIGVELTNLYIRGRRIEIPKILILKRQ